MLGDSDIGFTVGIYGARLQPERRHTLDALDRQPADPLPAHVSAATEAQSA